MNYYKMFSLFVILFLCNGGAVFSHDVGKCANNVSRISFEFSTETIPSEFIVTFHGYYIRSARENYMSAALKNVGIDKWNIIERKNAATEYPSDFDVVLLDPKQHKEGVSALQDHPAVKSVTTHKTVQRTVKYAVDHDCGSGCGKSRWQSHKSRKTKTGYTSSMRKLFRTVPHQITSVLKAEVLWNMGITGQGVRIGVFDTGLSQSQSHMGIIGSRTDWTGEGRVADALGHGTFVAGVIGSRQTECLGFAPDAELHIFRVFTDTQLSYTSWFLDAFNYAILRKMHVLNLSIGGPDFLDRPFVDKVWELSANRIIMVSAIGNDGPQYGTLNNPADQMDVIGVGGISFDDKLARFSSRGMTTWELPEGYGRMKPDIVTYGSGVRGSGLNGNCRSLSGTSVASPVVAGAVALLCSATPSRMSPASLKQALTATAARLAHANMFEQGHGKLDLLSAYDYLMQYTPRATLSPTYLDLTECPYMWPYCTQPLYHSALPVIVNVTIVNGVSVSAKVIEVTWHPHLDHGAMLSIETTYCNTIWPWAGWIALKLYVTKEGANFDGIVEGHVNVTIESPLHEGARHIETIMLPIRAKIIPVPVRERRLIWDQFHSLRYPGGYFPRDDLRAKHDPLDWHADHLHTNFRGLYKILREHGYFIEILGAPLTCVDPSLYGALLLVDPEDEYFPEELDLLRKAVHEGLSLMVFADWYNSTLLGHVQFYDENTRQWWVPETGGSNVPALNDLLSMFQVGLGDRVFAGPFRIGDHSMFYASGTHIHTFPEHGVIIRANLQDQGHQVIANLKPNKNGDTVSVPILGLLQTEGVTGEYFNETTRPESGRVVVYGDSSCLESGSNPACYWLFLAGLQYAITGRLPHTLAANAAPHPDVHIIPSALAQRAKDSRLYLHSHILSPDGSGPRTIPKCVRNPVLEPKPVRAPSYIPPRPERVPAPAEELDYAVDENAERTWRGAGGASWNVNASWRQGKTGAVVAAAGVAFLYAMLTLWRRGRRFRARTLLSLLA